MKFSTIVPVHNAERYLPECIDSVLAQSYRNYELILVNDGSSDSSGDICDRYRAAWPGLIKVIHSANQGPLAARSLGITASDGEVLMFLDADDKLAPEAFELLASAFASTGCDLIVFNSSVREDLCVPFCQYPFPDGTVFSGEGKRQIYHLLVSTSLFNSVWMKAAKRSALSQMQDIAAFSHVRNGEDLLMSARMLTDAEQILLLDRPLYYYRQHECSAVHTPQPHRARSVQTVHRYLEELVRAWGYPELVPVHHAREVRGWLETIRLSSARKPLRRSALCDMADDSYFRSAFERMDPKPWSRPSGRWPPFLSASV